ncbi:hypothetical protein [Pseudomonas sp. RIT-To-2]|uniref:hypothetical protein n=1 Tax=Pseudomonas sp. RIT-To-2 TaxID=3462541 RepID=UPI002412F371
MKPIFHRSVLFRVVAIVLLVGLLMVGIIYSPFRPFQSLAPRVGISPEQDAVEVLAYWTPARMKNAEKVEASYSGRPEEPILTPGGDVYGYTALPAPYAADVKSRWVGMLFFHRPSGAQPLDAHCSASIIDSESKSLIVTGAHCVMNAPKFPLTWDTQLMFVPAYNGAAEGAEQAPFGYWPIQRAFLPQEVADNPYSFWGAGSLDLAVARIYPQNNKALQEVVGGGFIPRFLTDDDTFNWVTLLGYPGPVQSGHGDGRQYMCYSRGGKSGLEGDKLSMPSCEPLGGNSGGPILLETAVGKDPEIIGTLTAPDGHNRLNKSVFTPLYNAAENSASAR